MGVYKFGAEFLYTLPYGQGKAKKMSGLPPIAHLFVDVNGILHNVAQRTFGYKGGMIHPKNKEEKRVHVARVKDIDGKDWTTLMGEYSILLFEALDELMDAVNPTDTICLVVDGVAPAAKIVQQRSRRIGNDTNVSKYYTNNSEAKANTGFSSFIITPGTKFMELVDEMLQKWIYGSKGYRGNLTHIYSSYRLPGEGEHKLFEIITSHDIGGSGNPNGIFAVEGLDSDLISLMVLRPQHFISVKIDRGEYTDIDEIKRFVINTANSRNKGLSDVLMFKDFVLMIYLVGNDFLPRFLFVDNVGETIREMLKIHKMHIDIPLTTIDDQINWSSFALFLSYLRRYEKSELLKSVTQHHVYKSPIVHSSHVVDAVRHKKDFMKYIIKDYHAATLLPKIGAHLLSDQNIRDEVSRSCKDMCEGLSWVLKYYTANDYSRLYTYSRGSAPLIIDLHKYVDEKAASEVFEEAVSYRDSIAFNHISQLMAIMPASKNALVPEPFKQDVQPGGKFGHIIPIGFPVKREKLKLEKDYFMEKAVLPPVDIEQIVSYVLNNAEEVPRGVLLVLN
jgi:5'-3' exonuclease